MRRHADLHEGRRWLDTAREDLRAARMLRDAGMPAHACFLAQQCAGKGSGRRVPARAKLEALRR